MLSCSRYLEAAGPELIKTRFGTLDCQPEDDIAVLSQKILGAAMRSYVEAEYDNLYETHQCRPHAYGHTWSPGFEIEAGLFCTVMPSPLVWALGRSSATVRGGFIGKTAIASSA